MKLLQFKASRREALMDLCREYMQTEKVPGVERAEQLLASSETVVYVSGTRVPMGTRNIKAKAPIVVCVPGLPGNLCTGTLETRQIVRNQQGLLIVEKPSGLSSQTTFRGVDDSLVHQILFYQLQSQGFPKKLPYVGMHHRLDRDTSGLLLFTLKPSKNKGVSDLFKQRKIHKKYDALVVGDVPGETWSNEKSIGKGHHPRHRFYFTPRPDGESAKTDFFLRKTFENGEHWVQCAPVTGRTHQLRVHLRADGLKIVGDRVYGARGKDKPMRLHARELRFQWEGQEVFAEVAPQWPEDIS